MRFASCAVGSRQFAGLVEGDSCARSPESANSGPRHPRTCLHRLRSVTSPRSPSPRWSSGPLCQSPGRSCAWDSTTPSTWPRERSRSRVPGAVHEVLRVTRRCAAHRSCFHQNRRHPTTRQNSPSSSAATSDAQSPHSALDAVAGYTIANDVTMRDFQYRSHQWLQGQVVGELDSARTVPGHARRSRRPASPRHPTGAQRRRAPVGQHVDDDLRHPDRDRSHLGVRSPRTGRRHPDRNAEWRRDPSRAAGAVVRR